MADKATKKVVTAIIELAQEKGFSIVTPEADDNDVISFIVIDEENSQVYMGTRQDYLSLDGGVLDIEG